MSSFTTIMSVALGTHHVRPGRTRHAKFDGKFEREFPPFVRLEIASFPGDNGYYLLHVCEDGSIADTHHGTVEEALHQAEWEFGVLRSEWKAAASNEPPYAHLGKQ